MEIRPVVCGVDIGSWTFKVCAYDGKHFEVLTNEANFRETPSLVSFTPSERLIGEEALNKVSVAKIS
jgi:molecular chaperone DnaK (HSP70)